ncbi:MAG: LysE family translocator, partial [Candidatus Kapabacteria bacterium]|nr:LysE family translocator [Candidatus Kapabacteria bacterium]
AGAAAMDALLCFLALIATGALGVTLGFIGAHPLLSLLIQLSCVGILVSFGIAQLRKRWYTRQQHPVLTEPPGIVRSLQRRGHFFLGLGMAAMNVVNPTFPSSLAYIGIVAHEFRIVSTNHLASIITFAVGFGFGNLCWLAVLAHGIHRFRHRLSTEALERLYRLVGVALIGVGTMLGIRVVTATRWHELLRLLPVF